MITIFKLFESENNIVFSDNSYWIIYGSKRVCANILISILNDGIIKDTDVIRKMRQKITMIENSIGNRNTDIIGMFLYHVDHDLALSYFRTESEKEWNFKTYYKDSIFSGELKLTSYGKVVLDTTESETKKYN